MAEEIKVLIEKIQKEGIQKAKDERLKIIDEAKKEANRILQEAKVNAAALISKAEQESLRKRESSDALLKQAGRDFLISLRSQINALLHKIIIRKVSDVLTAHEMSRIINSLIKDHLGKEKIELTFSKDDFAKMKESLLSQLSEEVAKGITFKFSEDISKGFTISFDSGKSYFDFSEQALADVLSNSFNKELSGILDLK